MRIAKQTPKTLVVKTNNKTRLSVIGLVLLAIGLLIISLVKIQPLTQSDLQTPSLLLQQQDGNPSIEGQGEPPSTSETSYRIANYTGRLLFTRELPWLIAGLISLVTGLIIVVGPNRSSSVIFDKQQEQVKIKEPGWFFRSKVETYAYSEISEISLERDRSRARAYNSYGANLIIGHSEGTPLTADYIFYKTVFPLSESFRYDYNSAKKVVDRITSFVAAA